MEPELGEELALEKWQITTRNVAANFSEYMKLGHQRFKAWITRKWDLSYNVSGINASLGGPQRHQFLRQTRCGSSKPSGVHRVSCYARPATVFSCGLEYRRWTLRGLAKHNFMELSNCAADGAPVHSLRRFNVDEGKASGLWSPGYPLDGSVQSFAS